MKKIVLRTVSVIMLMVAVIYLGYALTHPEFGTVFYIGKLEIGPVVWKSFYFVYALVMIGLCVASFLCDKKIKE